MKTKIILIMMVVILSLNVYGMEQPERITVKDVELILTTNNPSLSISAPFVPSTIENSDCIPWEIKGEYCSEDIRNYEQCQKTVSGGKWQIKSEKCSDYADNVGCINGKCVRTINMIPYLILLISIGVIVLFFVRFKK